MLGSSFCKLQSVSFQSIPIRYPSAGLMHFFQLAKDLAWEQHVIDKDSMPPSAISTTSAPAAPVNVSRPAMPGFVRGHAAGEVVLLLNYYPIADPARHPLSGSSPIVSSPRYTTRILSCRIKKLNSFALSAAIRCLFRERGATSIFAHIPLSCLIRECLSLSSTTTH